MCDFNKIYIKKSLDDFDVTTSEGQENLQKYINNFMEKELKETLEKGIPIVYSDEKYTTENEFIVEDPTGEKKIYSCVNGEKHFVRNL